VRYSDAALQAELAQLVGETCLNCMQLFVSRAPCPVDRCDTRHPERFQNVPDCAGTKAKWNHCLDRVNLTTAQENVLLQQRKACPHPRPCLSAATCGTLCASSLSPTRLH